MMLARSVWTLFVQFAAELLLGCLLVVALHPTRCLLAELDVVSAAAH